MAGFTFAERILANLNYIPKTGHAATLYGHLKHLYEDHPTYETVKKAFEKAGGERKLHERQQLRIETDRERSWRSERYSF